MENELSKIIIIEEKDLDMNFVYTIVKKKNKVK